MKIERRLLNVSLIIALAMGIFSAPAEVGEAREGCLLFPSLTLSSAASEDDSGEVTYSFKIAEIVAKIFKTDKE